MEPDADDQPYTMNKQQGRAMTGARKRSKRQLAVKATVPEGAKKVKVKAKVEMGKKGA